MAEQLQSKACEAKHGCTYHVEQQPARTTTDGRSSIPATMGFPEHEWLHQDHTSEMPVRFSLSPISNSSRSLRELMLSSGRHKRHGCKLLLELLLLMLGPLLPLTLTSSVQIWLSYVCLHYCTEITSCWLSKSARKEYGRMQ